MYAVIFKAQVNELDQSYYDMALRMRELAIAQYACKEFVSVTEGNTEIAVSYWESLDHIKLWKQDAEHLLAQKLGRSQWYKNYQVQIVELIREYSNDQ